MSERDRGDAPDGTPEASLSPAADAPAARARKTTRSARRRSLRVPVDEVPRRGSSAEVELDGSDPDAGLAPLASERTAVTDSSSQLLPPASSESVLSSSEDLALELTEDDEPSSDRVSTPELDGLPELDAEPTRVAPAEPGSAAAPGEPSRRESTSPLEMATIAASPIAMDGSLTTPRRPSSVPPPSALGFTTPASPPLRVDTGETVLPSEPPIAEIDAQEAPASEPPQPTASAPTQPTPSQPQQASAPTESPRASSPPGVAVVVSRVVRVTSPPPAMPPAAEASPPEAVAPQAVAPQAVAPQAVALQARRAEPLGRDTLDDDEPDVSVGEEPDEDVVIDVGEADERVAADDLASRMTDPSIAGPGPSIEDTEDAEVEVADLADSELDLEAPAGAAPMPPPPPRETARSQPRLAAVEGDRAPAEAARTAAEEEELAADDLEVEGDLAKKPSAPPPPPGGAPEKPKAAPPIPPGRAVAPAEAPAAAAKAEKPAADPAADPAAAAEARRAKKKANWWEDFFNDDYLRTVPPPNPRQIARQCDFIEGRLKLKTGSTILDVGCGLGLHAIELTRRGYLVVGLDLSLPMLSRAADEAQDQGFRINFLHADMREMNFEGAFDAVLCIGTTLGYFDDDQNRAVVERLYRALKPKGVLLLDVVNRDFVFKNQPNLVWFEGDGCVVMEETSANYITSRLHVKRTVILDDGRQRDNTYSVRLYALHELGQILHHRGFRVGEVSGREATPGVFFGTDSPRLIIVAERRPQQAAPPTPPGNKKPEAGGEAAPAAASPASEPSAPGSEATTTPGGTPSPGSSGSADGEPPASN